MQFESASIHRRTIFVAWLVLGSLTAVATAQTSPLTLPGFDPEPTPAIPALQSPAASPVMESPVLDSPMQFGAPANTPAIQPGTELPSPRRESFDLPRQDPIAAPGPTPALDQILNGGAATTVPAANPNAARQPELVAQLQPAMGPNQLSRLVTLQNISARTFRDRIGRTYKNRVQGQLVPGTKVESITVPAVNGRDLNLKVDYVRNSVILEGDPSTVASWERMIQFLDRPNANRGEQSDVVTIAQTKQKSVERVAEIVQNLAGNPKPTPRPPANIVQWNRDKTRTLAQAGPAAQAGGAGGEDQAQRGLTGPVIIQTLPGLDAILLKGNAPDVAAVRKVIDEIEAISQTTEPSIIVMNLDHVDSESMADLVRPLQDEILSSRQGQVSITPLIKPNAILMIGRLQGVNVLQDLVKKLDRPVDPDKEFHVFRLENLSALEAEQAIQRFYQEGGGNAQGGGATGTERPGLGAKVNVVADYRTNSLIVQANPRDAEELRQLLKKIDTTQAAAKDEVRVFGLKNTLATDVAPLLQQVLSGDATGAQQGVGGNQGFQGGGNQGAAGGTGTGAQTQRSATLSLRTLDRRGQRLYESGILTGVSVVPNTQGNTLVVRGPKDSMPLIAELIRQLDELPSEDAEVKVFTIVHGDATQLGTMLQTLFGTGATGNQGGNQGGVGGAGGGAGVATGAINPLIPLRFSIDARTNSIVATGSMPDLRVVEAILLRLDEADTQRQRKTETFRLRYAYAEDAAAAINAYLDGRRNLQTLAPETVPQLSQVEREVIVVPEAVSNTLIVSATPQYFEEIHRIVREMDAQPPMIAIQMLIAKVDLNRFYELGVEIGIQDPLLFDRGTGFNFNNTGALPEGGAGAAAGTLAGQALSNFGVGRAGGTGFGGLVLSAGNDAINILVRALQQDQRMQVLSRPQITTLDNQPAFVQVGQQVPFVTGTNVNGFGGTSSSVNLIDVGIILGVTPRVTPDGRVVMELDVTNSTLGAIADGIPIAVGAGGEVIRQPILDSTTAQSTVAARSGQTVVIGGLITESDSEVHRGVPYLSGIPLIGDLFRFDQDTRSRDELIIIMTPYVIRDDDDLECFNQMETSRMSWCLNDAYRLHGTGNACPSKWPTAYGNETQPQTIYPDRNPSAGPRIATPFSPLTSPISDQSNGFSGGPTGMNGMSGMNGMGAGMSGAVGGLNSVPPGAQILSDRALYPGAGGAGSVGTLPAPSAVPGLPSVPSLPSAGSVPQLLNTTP